MLELLMNPKKAERHPWELFFIGLFYGLLSLFLVNWMFSSDPVLSKYSGILVVTFTVMFSIPFMYYTIRYEEKKIVAGIGTFALLKEHKKAIFAFLWLFLGFVVAYSAWYSFAPTTQSFHAQIETYCLINSPTNFDGCVNQYAPTVESSKATGFVSSTDRLFMIFTNNIYVLIFTLIFSLLFGAGVIFVLAWNASVIAAAIGIFTNSEFSSLPLGILRYIIHGAPEIASYFIVALAGGFVSIAIAKHETGTNRFWLILQDSLNLVIIAVVVLFIAAILEVFVTPIFF